MADEQLIKPRELPAAATVFANDAIMTDDGVTVGKATPVQIVNAGAPVPTEAEAIAGTDNSKRMTPLTTKQVLDNVTAPSVLRAQAWAESGTPPDPGIPGSKSAKSWAAESERLGREQADRAEAAAADAVNNAPFVVKDADTFFALTGLVAGARYLAKDGSGCWDVLSHAETGVFNHPVSGNPLRVTQISGYHVATAYQVKPGGPSVDNYAALQLAINASTAAGFPLLITPGNYHISAGLTVPSNGHIVGTNRNTCVILGLTNTFTGVTLLGQQARVEGVYVRGCRVGIANTSNTTSFSQVENCRLSYNIVGIFLRDAYIFDVHRCYIAFNRIGVINGNQSFQVNFRANVIDNNLGGAGVISYGTAGLSLTDNTIEGNRRELSAGDPNAFGVGLWVSGYAQRVNVKGNWFEQNGNRDECSDIILGRPETAWVDGLAGALEDDLRLIIGDALFEVYFAERFPASGVIDIASNFFFATKRAISINLAFATVAAISVRGCEFVGTKSRVNRPVELYSSGTSTVTFEDNRVVNTGDISITTDMMQGVKASYVYHSGTVPAYGRCKLDGVDLFTAELTQAQFLALPGATLDAQVRIPTSGNAVMKRGAIRTLGGGDGVRVVQGSGRPRAGASAMFTVGTEYIFASLGRGAEAGLTVQGQTGFGFNSSSDAEGRIRIIRFTPGGAEAVAHTGDYYGWLAMPAATFDSSNIRGCTRLTITDLEIVAGEVTGTSIPTSWPSPATYLWAVGDYVKNSTPAADGYMGWVCTAAGAPGTWKGAGKIEA